MTTEELKLWINRNCRFAVNGKMANVIVGKLEQVGFRRVTGLLVLHLLLAGLETYLRRLSGEERQKLLGSLLNIANQLKGTVSLTDLRLRLPSLMKNLNVPLAYLRSPEVTELLEEAIQALRMRGRDVAKTKSLRDIEWEALKSLGDPLRYQPKVQLQEV